MTLSGKISNRKRQHLKNDNLINKTTESEQKAASPNLYGRCELKYDDIY